MFVVQAQIHPLHHHTITSSHPHNAPSCVILSLFSQVANPAFKWLLVREKDTAGSSQCGHPPSGPSPPHCEQCTFLSPCMQQCPSKLVPIQPPSCLEPAGGGKGHFKTHASFSRGREKASNGVHVYDTRHFIIIIIIHSALCTCILTTAL